MPIYDKGEALHAMHWIFAGYTEYVEGQWYDVTTYDELKWNNWATGNFPIKKLLK